jgi:hypothetical protein
MAIIDPDGLFSGERLAACSDLAQLYWPRFFLAANGCARLELSYKSLVSRVFGNFHKIPQSSEIWAIFREYEQTFLCVLYETEAGAWWCQFATSEKFLPKYKKTRDEMSPAPPADLMEKHRKGYLEWKRSKSFQNQSFQKIPESFGSEGVGIGVGIGVGVGEEQKPLRGKGRKKDPNCKTAIADGRHKEFKAAIEAYWKNTNPGLEMPWAQPEGMQLDLWLKASPKTTVLDFRRMLYNRSRSQVNQTERPSKWIRNVTDYWKPVDRFNKPPERANANGKGNANLAALNEVLADAGLHADIDSFGGNGRHALDDGGRDDPAPLFEPVGERES